MKIKTAKYKWGAKFKKGKKVLTVDGVFNNGGAIYYFFRESKVQLSENDLSKLQMITT